MPLGRKLVVEFIGTFFLVFTVCTATHPGSGAGALAPLAIGAVLMVMVFAGGHVSGGHYNPAVSTAVLLRGKMGTNEYGPYVAVQLVAGVLAALVARGVAGHSSAGVTPGVGKMLVVELLFTFALAWVVLNVATARGTDGNSFYGLAIGFTVGAGAFAVGGLSGGAFNPAVGLGASVMGLFKWSHYWIYVVGPLVGAAVAAFAFLYTQPAEKLEGDAEAARTGGVADELT